MISMRKLLILQGVGCLFVANTAMAQWSANVGVVSEYHFRGIEQTGDASASAGVDYESGGFNFGAWTADVGDGLEVDLYGGYAFDLSEDLNASIGFTTYQYTGDFDSAYNELNLGLGFGMFSLEYSIGTRDDDVSLGIAESDYTFFAVTVEHEGFYGQFGSFGDEADGEFFEVGYGTEVGGFDIGVSAIFASEELSVSSPQDDEQTIILSISKTFDL